MKMNCTQCQTVIDKDLQLALQDVDINMHLQECESCKDAWKEKLLKDQFKSMSDIPAMSDDFSQVLEVRIQKRADEIEGQQNAQNQPWFTYAGIAAAFMLVGILLQPLAGITPDYSPFAAPRTMVSITPNQLETVQIMLNSAQDYQDAELAITVTGAVRFDPDNSVQTVSWQTSLKQGKNVLPVPVYLANNKGGQIVIKMKTQTGFKQTYIDVAALDAKVGRDYL